MNLVQKTYKHGNDIAKALWDKADLADVDAGPPVRDNIVVPGGGFTDQIAFELNLKQQGYDIKYKEELRTYNICKEVYAENKPKAYALIFGYCNKVMQNRIEENPKFETDICDKPIEVLGKIKRKMYDPARGKYEYVTLTESIKRILETKQEDSESLVDYTKRFKLARDIMWDSVGEDILHRFVEKTAEYQVAGLGNPEKAKLKKASFGKWTTYLFMINYDQQKFISLINNFRTQYSLNNNQYCTKLGKATDDLITSSINLVSLIILGLLGAWQTPLWCSHNSQETPINFLTVSTAHLLSVPAV